MIWGDPWLINYFHGRRTLLPPIPPELPSETEFKCISIRRFADLEAWADFVRTSWDVTALRNVRLKGAWIALLYEKSTLRATCVLRPRGNRLWLLETLVARPRGAGWGSLLLRAAVRWLWDRTDGQFTVGFCWELRGLYGLAAAWWRGWLPAAVAMECGWAWRSPERPCGFCPSNSPRHSVSPRFPGPVLLHKEDWKVVVSDSGLGDGWGYVAYTEGPVDWTAVAAWGDWSALWARGSQAPSGKGAWYWTGEWIVLAALQVGDASPLARSDWISPYEVAFAPA